MRTSQVHAQKETAPETPEAKRQVRLTSSEKAFLQDQGWQEFEFRRKDKNWFAGRDYDTVIITATVEAKVLTLLGKPTIFELFLDSNGRRVLVMRDNKSSGNSLIGTPDSGIPERTWQILKAWLERETGEPPGELLNTSLRGR